MQYGSSCFLVPTEKPLVIDLVRETGIDVSDWSNFKGKDPSVNPRYCYNWSFHKPGEFVVALLWHGDLTTDGGKIIHNQNIRLRDGRLGGGGAALWKRRAAAFDESMQEAYRLGLPIRAIILDGNKRDHLTAESKKSIVARRLLDPVHWAVVSYNFGTGDCILVRGEDPIASTEDDAPEIEGFEGQKRRHYIIHRRREARLRRKKIEAALYQNSGVLRCEVPNCGFDFQAVYGEVGEKFAHVHHLEPLSDAPDVGKKTDLTKLAIVCANCHAMIHRGGSAVR